MKKIYVLVIIWNFAICGWAQVRLIPHITRADGGFKTDLILASTDSIDACYLLTAFDSRGQTLEIVEGVVPAGQTIFSPVSSLFESDGISHLMVEGDGFHLSAVYQSNFEGGGPAHVGESYRQALRWQLYMGDNTISWDGLAVINTGREHAQIQVRLLDENNMEIDAFYPAELQNLGPNQKGLYVLPASVSNTRVEIMANQPLALTALRGDVVSSRFLWQNLAATLRPSVDFRLEWEIRPLHGPGNQSVEAEWGSFWVPAKREDLNGKQINLKFVRLKSTNTNPGPPIVYLAGGPGGSGIEAAENALFELFQTLRAYSDVIALDQRGTGLSDKAPNYSFTFEWPHDRALEREEIGVLIGEWSSQALHFWNELGHDEADYNTIRSAHDIDALRQALGAKKMVLLGYSYGTHLALTALRLHGDTIHKAILAGVEGPDHTYKLPSDTQALLQRIDNYIQEDENARALYPDFLGSVQTTLSNLELTPAIVQTMDPLSNQQVSLTIGPFDVQQVATAFLRGPELSRFLPAFFAHMAAGNYSDMAPFFLEARRAVSIALMPSATDIASGISVARQLRIQAERTKTLLDSAINFPLPELAAGFSAVDLGMSFRAAVQTQVPTLFISGSLDGRTPINNALEVIEGFENGIQLTIEGGGHNDLLASHPGIYPLVEAFIQGTSVSDTTIAIDAPDFVNVGAKISTDDVIKRSAFNR